MALRNVTYQQPIHQEENTPLVTILETRTDTKQSVAIDSRKAEYVVDLTKASFGGIQYPTPGTQWYLKKISSVWALMARAPRQNPQLDPAIDPVPGETYIGGEGTTHIVGDLDITGTVTAGGGLGSGVSDGDKGDITVSGSGAVWTIDNDAVTTAKVINDAITNGKLDNMAQSTIKGRAASAGTGDPTDLSVSQVTTVLGGTSSTTLAIGDHSHTAIANANLATMAQSTIKGRAAAAGTGTPTDLSVSEVTTIMGGTSSTTLAIGNHSHTAIANADLATMAQSTIKGRAAGAGTGTPTDLSVAQVAAIAGGTTSTTLALGNHGHFTTYACTSQLDKTNTTLEDIPGLAFSVETGVIYYVVALIAYSGPTAADVQFDWGRTGGVDTTDILRFVIGIATNTTTNQTTSITMARRDGDTNQAIGADGAAGSAQSAYVEHVVITPTASGGVTFRYSQNSASGTSSVFTTSRLLVTRTIAG